MQELKFLRQTIDVGFLLPIGTVGHSFPVSRTLNL